jgi:hypothetical protein
MTGRWITRHNSHRMLERVASLNAPSRQQLPSPRLKWHHRVTDGRCIWRGGPGAAGLRPIANRGIFAATSDYHAPRMRRPSRLTTRGGDGRPAVLPIAGA